MSGTKMFLMLVIALLTGGSMVGVLLWCLRRLKRIERERWGDKANARGHST